MFKVLDEYNTQGKIQTFLTTYKDLEMRWGGLNEFIEWYKGYIKEVDKESSIIAFDIETSKLYPIDNKFLMFAFAYKHDNIYKSVAFDCRDWSREEVIKVLKLINKFKSKIVLHNAYFDITTLAIMYGVKVKWDYDTYIIYHNAMTHRAKDVDDKGGLKINDENLGLSLKDLTKSFLPYGDYEEVLNNWKKDYCKNNKVKINEEFTYDVIPSEILAPYNCMDVICTLRLFEFGLKVIKSLEEATGFTKLRSIIKLMHETTDIYMKARIRGLNIDRDAVISVSDELHSVMVNAEKNIYIDLEKEIMKYKDLTRKEYMEKLLMTDFENFVENTPTAVHKNGNKKFSEKQVKLKPSDIIFLSSEIDLNLNSPKQKQKLFCEIMALEPLELTPKKAPKVNTAFFEHYAENGYPQLKNIVRFLKAKKGINDFLGYYKHNCKDVEKISNEEKSLWGLTSDKVDKVYPSYNLCGTRTFRTSTTTPNTAQVPSRGDIAKIKKCYIAPKGFKMFYFDYSSMELVLGAGLTKSKPLKEALESGYDLHSITAYDMFLDDMIKEKPEMVEFINSHTKKEVYEYIKNNFEKTYRYRSKSVRFTVNYSGTEHSLAKNLKCSKTEAKKTLESYFKANPELKEFFNKCHKLAIDKGYTENYFGARQLLDKCKGYNKNSKSKDYVAEAQLRKSTNFPVQSLNSFLIYRSMVAMDKDIIKKGYEDKMWMAMTVYDSACYYVHDSIPDNEVVNMLENNFMCTFMGMDVKIDIEKGYNWYELEKVESIRKGNMEGLLVYE